MKIDPLTEENRLFAEPGGLPDDREYKMTIREVQREPRHTPFHPGTVRQIDPEFRV